MTFRSGPWKYGDRTGGVGYQPERLKPEPLDELLDELELEELELLLQLLPDELLDGHEEPLPPKERVLKVGRRAASRARLACSAAIC